jgi:O-antigen ligase
MSLGWMLWTCMVALPYLLATHTMPWTMFQADALMAGCMAAAAAWILFHCPKAGPVSVLAVACFALAAVPLAQAAAGMFVWPGEAMWPSLYLAATAVVMAIARIAEMQSPGRLVEALLAGLVIASLASTGMLIYQWADLSGLGLLIAAPVAAGRPAANLGQPNLLASLLVWGLIGIWWATLKHQLRGPVAMGAAAFLLLGLAITQSRTGWLGVAVLGVAALAFRGPLQSRRHALGLLMLALWFALWVAGWTSLNEWLAQDVGRGTADQASAGKRPLIWSMMLQASLQSPWLGYGWNQGTQAHMAAADVAPQLAVVVAHAHNFALDLVIWNGWPLGLALLVGLVAWLVRLVRRVRLAEDVLLLVAIVVFLAHASLELPHVLFVFLAPVAVFAGSLEARHPKDVRWTAPRSLLAGLLIVLTSALLVMWIEYQKIEADLLAYRIRMARIGDPRTPPPPTVLLLRPLQHSLQALRIPARRNMPEADLQALQRAVQRYPSDGGLFTFAQASALNGQPQQAALALARLCMFYPPPICQTAGKAWIAIGAQNQPELRGIQTPSGFTPRPIDP